MTLEGRDASITAVTEATPEATPALHAVQGDAGHCRRRSRRRCARKRSPIIRETVQPAYAKLLKFMRSEYVPGARTTLAAERLPDGKAYYRAKILEYTTLDMDPQAIHAARARRKSRGCTREMLDGDEGDGLQGRLPGLPEVPAHRPAVLRQDAAGAADARRLDRQEVRRQGRRSISAICRARVSPSSRCPDDLAPFYTAGPRRAGRLSAQHLRPAEPAALQPDRADAARIRAGPRVPDAASRWSTRTSRNSASTPTSRPTAKAGRSTASGWASRWACTRRPTSASACWATRSGARRGWSSTPASMHKGWTREQAIQYMHDIHRARRSRDRDRSGPLHRLAGAGAVLLSGRDGDPEGARTRRKRRWGRSSTSAPSTTRCCELGSVPLPVLEARIDRFIAEGGKGPYPDLER